MSFINIINESFDKQNKKILAGSNGKKLKEAAFTDNFNGHSDELDRFYDYMFEAAKDLGFQDFDAFDDGWTVTLTYIDAVGNKQQAEFDFDDELSFESKEDAIDCLVSLDWKVVDDEDTKSLREYFDYGEAEDLDELDDMLDQSGSLIYEAAEKLGLKDFEWEDSVQGAMGMSEFWITDEYGERLYASVDFSETWVTDIDEAIMLLDNLEWEVVDDGDEDLDEDLDTQSKNDLDFNEDDSSDSLKAKIEKLKNLDHIPDFFFGDSSIRSIVIPSNIKSIGDYAFVGCRDLKNITIPNSITSIGWGAFWSCSGLTNITIPDSVTRIGGSAFLKCDSLKNITLPSSITNIDRETFADCSGLTNITIPDSVTSIGDYAFFRCSNLKSIKIPNSVTSIGEQAFYSCTGLTSVVIGNSVKSIGDWAFRNCAELTRITIPSSVISIGYKAFMECENLKEITYEGTKADWNKIEKQPAWNDYSSIETIHCTDGDIEIENN